MVDTYLAISISYYKWPKYCNQKAEIIRLIKEQQFYAVHKKKTLNKTIKYKVKGGKKICHANILH